MQPRRPAPGIRTPDRLADRATQNSCMDSTCGGDGFARAHTRRPAPGARRPDRPASCKARTAPRAAATCSGAGVAQVQAGRCAPGAREPDRPAAFEQVPALDARLRSGPGCEHRAVAVARCAGREPDRGHPLIAKGEHAGIGRAEALLADLRSHDLAEGRHVRSLPSRMAGHVPGVAGTPLPLRSGATSRTARVVPFGDRRRTGVPPPSSRYATARLDARAPSRGLRSVSAPSPPG